MRKFKILSAVLAVLPIAVLLTAQASRGEPAADECRDKPGAAGPPGTHWFYHVDRTDGRHCWYLNADGEKAHQSSAKTEAHASPSDATLQRENNDNLEVPQTQPVPAPIPAPMTTAAAPAPMVRSPAPSASALASPPDLGMRRPAPIDFSTRWQNLPKPLDLNAREAAAANNNSADNSAAADNSADQSTAADDAAALPDADADADADSARSRQSPVGKTNSGSVLLAGVLIVASSLLFAGGVVRLLNRPRRRRAGRWLKARRPMRAYFGAATARRATQVGLSMPKVATAAIDAAPRIKGTSATATALGANVTGRSAAAASVIPTDPSHDLQGSLQELMGDLRRAGATSPSLQSFVPSAYQRPKRAAEPTSSSGDSAADGKQIEAQVVESRSLSLEEELLRHFGGDVMVADNAG